MGGKPPNLMNSCEQGYIFEGFPIEYYVLNDASI